MLHKIFDDNETKQRHQYPGGEYYGAKLVKKIALSYITTQNTFRWEIFWCFDEKQQGT